MGKRRKKSSTSTKIRAEKEQPPSFITSLPDDLIIDILARVPRCDYTTLSLVSKHFQSLVFSPELYARRSLLGYTKKKFECGFAVREADGYNWGNNYRTIYVKGFDTSISRVDIKRALRKHFSSCGKVVRVFVPIECETGDRLGFAFINLKRNEEKKALTLNGSELGGKKLEVMMAIDREDFYSYPYPNSKGCSTCRIRDHRSRIYSFHTATSSGRLMSIKYLATLEKRTWPNFLYRNTARNKE